MVDCWHKAKPNGIVLFFHCWEDASLHFAMESEYIPREDSFSGLFLSVLVFW